jgi:hypothetical protein
VISFGKVSFYRNRHFEQSQVSSISFKVFNQGFDKLASGFLARFIFSGKDYGLQSHFFQQAFW